MFWLDKFKKSREALLSQNTYESLEEDFSCQHYTSLTFLGQIYDVEIASDEEAEWISETDDVFG